MKNNYKNILKEYEILIKEIDRDKDKEMFFLIDSEVPKFQDVLALLEERGYVTKIKVTNMCGYKKLSSLSDFHDWLVNKIKEEKATKLRERLFGLGGILFGWFLDNIWEFLKSIIE